MLGQGSSSSSLSMLAVLTHVYHPIPPSDLNLNDKKDALIKHAISSKPITIAVHILIFC